MPNKPTTIKSIADWAKSMKPILETAALVVTIVISGIVSGIVSVQKNKSNVQEVVRQENAPLIREMKCIKQAYVKSEVEDSLRWVHQEFQDSILISIIPQTESTKQAIERNNVALRENSEMFRRWFEYFTAENEKKNLTQTQLLNRSMNTR